MKTLLPIFVIMILLISCTDNAKKETKQENVKVEENENSFENSKADYIKKGLNIAQNSGKTLKGKLSAAIKSGGLPNGVTTCNNIAQKLMDSLSLVHNAKIKRTSMKLRNSTDAPDHQELSMMSEYNKLFNEGEKLKPVVRQYNDSIRFYAPIFMEDVCLNCHGVIGENIKQENYNVIKKHYPRDEAIEYKLGDLRAIWSVTFNK